MNTLVIKGEDKLILKEGTKLVSRLNTYLYKPDNILEVKNVEYSILNSEAGVEILPDGTLILDSHFNAGDENGTDIFIRAVTENGGVKYTADKSIHVSPAPFSGPIITKKCDFSILEKEISNNTEEFIVVNKNIADKATIEVDVASLRQTKGITVYQIAKLFSDGSLSFNDIESDKDTLTIQTEGAVACEVTKVLKYAFGYDDGMGNTYTRVLDTDEYSEETGYGFIGERNAAVGHITFSGQTESCFVCNLPDGYVNVRIYKSDEERSTIRINGGSVGTNVGNPGKGSRDGIRPYTYYVEELKVTNGRFYLSMDERSRSVKAVEIRRATTLRPRRTHIFIGGDSTASNYYPIENNIPKAGRFQTGWGQVFSQLTKDSNVVINIAGGGTFAKSWYEMAFKGVLQHGEAGDYFLIEEGLNDRTYSNQEEMADYLSRMIDECRHKGIIPVLVTAMQTAKFWKDADGNEVGEHEMPMGSGLFAFAETIRDVAVKKDAFIADVSAESSKLYKELGRTYVAHNLHIYNEETNTEEDTLHLSYEGAVNTAQLVATILKNNKSNGVKNSYSETLDGLYFNDIKEKRYFVDKDTVVVKPLVEAIYEGYCL